MHCVIASIVKGVDVVALGSTDSGVPHEDCLRLLFLKNNLYVDTIDSMVLNFHFIAIIAISRFIGHLLAHSLDYAEVLGLLAHLSKDNEGLSRDILNLLKAGLRTQPLTSLFSALTHLLLVQDSIQVRPCGIESIHV